MANQMFRLALASRDGNSQKAMQYYDEGLTTMLKVLEAKEAEQKVSTVLSSEIGNTITNAYLARDVFEPIPVPNVKKNPPTLVIHQDLSPNVIVTKEDSHEKTIRLDSGNEVRTDIMRAYPFCEGTTLSSLRINVCCGEDEAVEADVEEAEEAEEAEAEEAEAEEADRVDI